MAPKKGKKSAVGTQKKAAAQPAEASKAAKKAKKAAPPEVEEEEEEQVRPMEARHLDIASVLLSDHRHTVALLHHFQQAMGDTDTDDLLIETLVDAICLDIRLHSQAEFDVLYPYFENMLGKKGKEIARHSREAHVEIENNLVQALEMRKEGKKSEELEELISTVMQEFEAHLQQEEEEYMPLLLEKASEEDLLELVEPFFQSKMNAPLMPPAEQGTEE